MGQLDEAAFAAAIVECAACKTKAFEVSTYIDRQMTVMLGERNDDGPEYVSSSSSIAVTASLMPMELAYAVH